MKKIIFLLCICTIFYSDIFSQGFRIKLLKNLNQYPSTGVGYSACWGYTAPNGREYAILGCLNGTSFVDITDTANIHEVAYLPAPSGVFGSIWREMKTYSHYAYIVSEASGSNLQVVDLQYLPDSIRYVGKLVLGTHTTTHTISQSGPYLYLNGANPSLSSGVAIVDLSINPEAPVLRGTWDELYVHDSRIVNDTIWACNISNGKVSVIDARNKDNLITIADWVHNPPPNAPHNIALTNDRRYALVTDEVFSPAGRLKVWNVSDLGNITYVTSFDATPFETADVHNIEIYNNYAFLAYYAAGVKVLNISNPEIPVELGWYDTYPDNNVGSGCWAVYFFPTGKIIASDMYKGLFVLKPDLSNPVAAFPRADFTVGQLEVKKRDSIRIIDMTEGIPNNYLWTVTGTQTKTSTLKHPKFAFDSIGQYNVKLRVTNSFGTDSVLKTNVFHVVYAPIASFNVVTPTNFTTILTSPNDTGRVLFNWRKAVDDPDIHYKMLFKKVTGTNEIGILTGNNGADSFALVRKSQLDSVANQLGFTSDSVVVHFKVRAYLGADSGTSTTVLIILKRTTIGISNNSEVIPRESKLYNNYPNPFNPVTNINFDLPSNSDVKLVVYDVLGKETAVLLDEKISAGSYKYTFNAGNLNSGVYFVKLTAGDYSSIIRIVLLK